MAGGHEPSLHGGPVWYPLEKGVISLLEPFGAGGTSLFLGSNERAFGF
jgi:hypothetical protein